MVGKKDGRNRVHKILARSGYGKNGAKMASGGAPSQHNDDIESHLEALESEVEGGSPKSRLDRKSRASGGSNKWMQHLDIKKGAMTEAAKREGVSNAKYEQEHKHDSGKAGKRARLALVFKKSNQG